MDGDGDEVDPEQEVHRLKDILDSERKERQQIEQEACDILRSIRKKYDRAIQQRNQEIADLRASEEQVRQRVEDLETNNRDIAEELNQCKLDLKKCREDLKTSQKRTSTSSVSCRQIDELKEEVADLQDQIKTKEGELKLAKERHQFTREMGFELREKNSDLTKKLRDTTEKLSNLRSEIEAEFFEKIQAVEEEVVLLESKEAEQEAQIKELKETITGLNQRLDKKDQRVERQSAEIERLQRQAENHRQERNEAIESERKDLMKQLRDLRANLDQKSEKLKKSEVANRTLRDASDDLQKHADECEQILEKRKLEYERLLHEKKLVEKERNDLKLQVSDHKRKVSAENGQMNLLMNDIKERMKTTEISLSSERERSKALQKELDHEKRKGANNISKIDELTRELDRCVQEANLADERSAHLEEEIREIKEEAARHISEILNQKSRCNRLKISLDDANDKILTLEARITSLLTEMDTIKTEGETERYRLTERLRQHHELENEMMKKIDKLEKKKKPLFDVQLMSPRVPNRNPRTPVNIRDVRDFEVELEKERQLSRKLQEELNQIEAELLELKMQNRMKRLGTKSPGHEEEDEVEVAVPTAPPSYLKYDDVDTQSLSTVGSVEDNSVNDEDDEHDATISTMCQEQHAHRHTVSADVHHGPTSSLESSSRRGVSPQKGYSLYRKRAANPSSGDRRQHPSPKGRPSPSNRGQTTLSGSFSRTELYR